MSRPPEPRDRRFPPPPEPVPAAGPPAGPHFLLMAPRSPANCGAAARALKNFGFRSLALVALPDHPDKDYLGEHARATAWRAFDVLQHAARPATLQAARAPLRTLIAIDPAPPEGVERIGLERMAELALADPDGTGLLFGRENDGLTAEELRWCRHGVALPSTPDYPDLNLAQSVLLVAAEIHRLKLRRAGIPEAPVVPVEAASLRDLHRLVAQAAPWLGEIDFVAGGRWRPARGLLALLLRARPRPHEIRLLLGVIHQARLKARRKAD